MTIQSVICNNNPNNETIQWACNYLTSHGYELKTKLPEIVQDTPWSYVIRFVTSVGLIYLKQTPEQLALEATIIQTLHEQFHAPVSTVIAHNTELKCCPKTRYTYALGHHATIIKVDGSSYRVNCA
jgi:hypothetical protein